MNNQQIKKAVERFMSFQVNPFMTADQATAMFEYCLQDSVEAEPAAWRFKDPESPEIWRFYTFTDDIKVKENAEKFGLKVDNLYLHPAATKEEDEKILEALKLADDCISDIQEYNVPQWILSNIESAIEILTKRLS